MQAAPGHDVPAASYVETDEASTEGQLCGSVRVLVLVGEPHV